MFHSRGWSEKEPKNDRFRRRRCKTSGVFGPKGTEFFTMSHFCRLSPKLYVLRITGNIVVRKFPWNTIIDLKNQKAELFESPQSPPTLA